MAKKEEGTKKSKGKAGKVVKTVFSSVAILFLAFIFLVANVALPTYGRMVNELLAYKQFWSTPKTDLDLQYNKHDIPADQLASAGQSLNEEIAGEGMVLLQNDGALPLAAGTELSLFSHSSVDVLAGGYLGGITLKDALESRGFSVNETLWNFYANGSGKGYKRGAGSISYGRAEDFSINECPLSVITGENGLTDTFSGTCAVFVWSRVVGEGRDMPRSMYSHTDVAEDKSKSYLEPDSVEMEILQYLNDNFNDVILLINSPSVMELGWAKEMPHITGVEKPSVDLAAYAKTDLLEPGASQTVTATFTKEQMKAYDAKSAGTYILDAGDYYVTVAPDAHKAVNNILAAKGAPVDGNAAFASLYNVAEQDGATYAVDSCSGVEIRNLFDEDAGSVTYLTRSDWAGTFPAHDGEVSSFANTWGNEINGTDGGSYVYTTATCAARPAPRPCSRSSWGR